MVNISWNLIQIRRHQLRALVLAAAVAHQANLANGVNGAPPNNVPVGNAAPGM